MGKRKHKGRRPKSRRFFLKFGCVAIVVLTLWGIAGEWFVHHPRAWIDGQRAALPGVVVTPLLWLGNPLADITDAWGWTGHDAVYEYDADPPSGQILFAGAPRRVGPPAPDDIRILRRGEFLIGWSDRLRHPVWCAYHVTRDEKFKVGKRPNFAIDRSLPAAPKPNDYAYSGYDRGHMVPNYAIATRYGDEERRKTFLMSNVAPQSPALNRGVWRDIEHRISALWTARYGEIWVIVGCVSKGDRTIPGTGIDVPSAYYQVVLAQEGMDVRALATLFDQQVPWDDWAARHIVTIDELEELTGLDFHPDLPAFIQEPLEADLPSRLWPIRPQDIFRQISSRFN